MSIFSDENGNLKLRQGDSGTIVFEGDIPYDKYTSAYFSITNPSTFVEIVKKEIAVTPLTQRLVFTIAATDTDTLPIDDTKTFTTYIYGLKLCTADEQEDTYIPSVTVTDTGTVLFGISPKVYVYPKIVEGTTGVTNG